MYHEGGGGLECQKKITCLMDGPLVGIRAKLHWCFALRCDVAARRRDPKLVSNLVNAGQYINSSLEIVQIKFAISIIPAYITLGTSFLSV